MVQRKEDEGRFWMKENDAVISALIVLFMMILCMRDLKPGCKSGELSCETVRSKS